VRTNRYLENSLCFCNNGVQLANFRSEGNPKKAKVGRQGCVWWGEGFERRVEVSSGGSHRILTSELEDMEPWKKR